MYSGEPNSYVMGCSRVDDLIRLELQHLPLTTFIYFLSRTQSEVWVIYLCIRKMHMKC